MPLLAVEQVPAVPSSLHLHKAGAGGSHASCSFVVDVGVVGSVVGVVNGGDMLSVEHQGETVRMNFEALCVQGDVIWDDCC